MRARVLSNSLFLILCSNQSYSILSISLISTQWFGICLDFSCLWWCTDSWTGCNLDKDINASGDAVEVLGDGYLLNFTFEFCGESPFMLTLGIDAQKSL